MLVIDVERCKLLQKNFIFFLHMIPDQARIRFCCNRVDVW